MGFMEADIYTIQQLEEHSGVSRRTIRFYITREILPPPEGSKRGSYYTKKHLDTLVKIRELVEDGYPLFQVKSILDSGEEEKPSGTLQPTPHSLSKDLMERYTLAPGLELHAKVGKLSSSCLEKMMGLLLEEGVLPQPHIEIKEKS